VKIHTQLAIISVLVKDQDEALRFYTEKLGLEKREDVTYGPGMRWLTVGPKGQKKPEIALACPDPALHSQQGQRPLTLVERAERSTTFDRPVAWVFDTKNCCKMYKLLQSRGVMFLSPPTRQRYGTEAVFADPYGNVFSLLEPSPTVKAMTAA
jgi:predicted enzyme related to lactoylglutathione lyase